jgi:toxin-antitoxin system PIN domain toxin
MIAVDTNILVYAHRSDLEWHAPARARLEALAGEPTAWAVPMHCLHEFYATVTRLRPLAQPTPPEVALRQLDNLLACENLVVLAEDGEHWRVLHSLLEAGVVRGGAVHDARIAACCLRHGVSELWTADRDFSRYPALRVRNPLVAVNERRSRYRARRAARPSSPA